MATPIKNPVPQVDRSLEAITREALDPLPQDMTRESTAFIRAARGMVRRRQQAAREAGALQSRAPTPATAPRVAGPGTGGATPTARTPPSGVASPSPQRVQATPLRQPVPPGAQAPLGAPQGPAAPPRDTGREGSIRVLTPQEWASQNFPNLTRFQVLPRKMHDSLMKGYQQYTRVRIATEQLGQRGRREDRLADEGVARDKRQDALLGLTERRTKTGEARERRLGEPSQGTGTQTGQLSVLMAEAVDEVRRTGSTDGPAFKRFKSFKSPGSVRDAELPTAVVELLAGRGSFGGVLQLLAKDPVAGWVDLARRLEAMTLGLPQGQAAMLQDVVRGTAPSFEEVIAAEKEGRITPEQRGFILQRILSAEQQEQLLAPTGAAEPASGGFMRGLRGVFGG